MARRSKPPLASLIEAIGPPISSTAWSPKFTAQTLEVLPVGLSDGALFWMKPLHADSLRVGLPPSATPADVVLDVLKWYPLAPVVVHSTSWRHEEGRIILTYVAVVQKPTRLPPDSLAITPVKRAELARGEAMAAPKTIGVDAVLEHALRHLSWLARDDPAVMQALAGWSEALADFQPEPFRALA
ncbi:MAG: hypothetical protein AUI15_39975 [Actinobacteria bacterium 13_2_20CM_2_66_6]|nr:MAG: hypothetical protein AUI15_39975 [Actinobacteria bacterium 13_2_20CM_2_66_6]